MKYELNVPYHGFSEIRGEDPWFNIVFLGYSPETGEYRTIYFYYPDCPKTEWRFRDDEIPDITFRKITKLEQVLK